MSDLSKKPPASAAPVYAALYQEWAELFRGHGYALAIHGSLRRDFDLIAVPWIEQPSAPADVMRELTEVFAVRLIGEPSAKLHGREAWTVSIGHGTCAADISFTPMAGAAP